MRRSERVARNVGVMFASQIVSWVLATVVMLYLPRYAGDTGLGQITLAASILALFSGFASLGSSMVIVKDIAKDRSRAGDYLTASLILRALLVVLVILLCNAAVALLHYSPRTRVFVAIGSGALILNSVNDIAYSILRGQENIPRQTLSDFAGKLVSSGLTIGLVLLHASLWTIVAVGIPAAALSLVINLAALRDIHLPRPNAGHLRLAKYLVTSGMPFVAMGLFLTIYGQCGPIVLHHLDGDAAVGWYGLSRRFSGTAMFIPTIVAGALLPTLTRLRHEDPGAFPFAVRRTVNLMLLCVAPVAVLLICLPEKLIRLLHYPPSYQHAAPVFMVSGVGLAIWFVTQLLGTAMVANEQQHALSRAAMGSVILMVPACLGCVWVTTRLLHNGAIGAAIADNVTECYMLLFYLRVLPRGIVSGELLRYALKISLAATLMLLLIFACNRWLGVGALVPGLCLYIVLCFRLRCVNPQDLAVLRSLVPNARA